MAGEGPADLHSLAQDYLQACVEALDTIPGSPGVASGSVGAPTRQFVTYGTPAADCDHSNSLDLFDFLCFTNAFNAGC